MIGIDVEIFAALVGDHEGESAPVSMNSAAHKLQVTGERQAAATEADNLPLGKQTTNLPAKSAVLSGWDLK